MSLKSSLGVAVFLAASAYVANAAAATCTVSSDGATLTVEMWPATPLTLAADAAGVISANGNSCAGAELGSIAQITVVGTPGNDNLIVELVADVSIMLGLASD